MKSLYLFFLLPAFSFTIHAQSIHGIWAGTLVNDSTHRTQNFEFGLSEYRGKITGYTYTTFIDNDTFYYSIKRIKAERKDGKLIIEDEEMVGNNFPEKAAKHVKQTTTFPLINDSTIDITNGRWSTNQTKKYYPIGGSATVQEQEDEKQSDLLAHLQEANIKNDITVNQKKKKENETVAKNTSPAKLPQNDDGNVSKNKNKDVVKNPETVSSKISSTAEINNTQKAEETKSPEQDKKEDIAINNKIETKEKESDKNTGTKQTGIPAVSHVQQTAPVNLNKKNSINDQPVSQTNTSLQKKGTVQPITRSTDQPVDNNPEKPKIVSNISINIPQAQRKELIEKSRDLPAIVADRKNENIQDIYFKNDSLVLSLYDNGIVDGDTVSVFLNGDPVFSKQMLKAVATKKTVYFSAATDTVQLVLFAENLGSIPPNTGLLIIKDGDDSYQVHFSADLQKNASITLRRKKL